jgi:signal transduction histidine kinase
VHASLATLRLESAVVFARVRVGLHLCLLGTLALATLTHVAAPAGWMGGLEAAAALGSIVILVLLDTRKMPSAVIAGAVIDWLSLFSGAWLHLRGLTPFAGATGLALLSIAADFILVSAALTLPPGVRETSAAAVVSSTAVWGLARGFTTPVVLLMTGHVLALAAAMVWVGWRVTRVASQRALADHAFDLVHAERDQLDAVNRQLEQTNAGLRESQRQAETLTQLVVHDLRNPLASVLASLDLVVERIAQKPTLSEEHGDLAVAAGEARRLGTMLNDLLTVGRLENGELGATLEPSPVRRLFDATATAFRSAAASRGIRLAIEADPDLIATLDATLMRRLLDNLVSNALRHTAAGDRIELAASPEGASLRIAVRNSGAPLSTAARERLFEKHATTGEASSSNFGLGLYLCRLVARSHDGTIALVDRPGWTVSFETVFPAAPRPAASDAGASATRRETGRCACE